MLAEVEPNLDMIIPVGNESTKRSVQNPECRPVKYVQGRLLERRDDIHVRINQGLYMALFASRYLLKNHEMDPSRTGKIVFADRFFLFDPKFGFPCGAFLAEFLFPGGRPLEPQRMHVSVLSSFTKTILDGKRLYDAD